MQAKEGRNQEEKPYTLEIKLMGFKRHNSLLNTVYASTVSIINLIPICLFGDN